MAPPRKIPMKKRETRAKRAVTFSKRRYGLFNKAAELCIISGAQIAIVVSSPCLKQNIFSFGHPSVDSVFDAFLYNRVPPLMGDEVKLSSVSLCNEIKELEQEPKNGENIIGGLFKDFEDLEKNFESVDELLAVEEKMENLKNNAMGRLSELLSSKAFAAGNSGNNSVQSDNNFSNEISPALASEFSHLHQILVNCDNKSVFNHDFLGQFGGNSFCYGNDNVGINNGSTSNAIYLNQEVEFGAMPKPLPDPDDYFSNQKESENLQAMFGQYENKVLPFYSSANVDQLSTASFGDHSEAKPLAAMNQFNQLSTANFGDQSEVISLATVDQFNQFSAANYSDQSQVISLATEDQFNQFSTANYGDQSQAMPLATVDFSNQNEVMSLAAMDQFDQFSNADFGYQNEIMQLTAVDQFGQFFTADFGY